MMTMIKSTTIVTFLLATFFALTDGARYGLLRNKSANGDALSERVKAYNSRALLDNEFQA